MHTYTSAQWVLFFFFYCLCGWVWESCYVSLCQRRWVNRGFLHGPLLPIYGSGAIIILLATIPVRDNLLLIFCFGLVAATVLEYATGAAMEALFKVRYWDYSSHPCNLNGHICLSSSLAWGGFSILLVRFIHPPIERLLLRIPLIAADPIALVLTTVFTVDVVQSVQAALDLKETLTRLTEENEELRRLARRAEVFAAFAQDDLKAFRDRTEAEKLLFQDRLEADLTELRAARAEKAIRYKARLEARLRRRADAKLQALDAITQAVTDYRDKLDGEALDQRREELADLLRRIHDREAAIRSRTIRTYRRSLRILRANPSASAKHHAEALDALKTLDDTKTH